MALDATIGGTTADTYVTLAEFHAYATAMGWSIGGHGHDDLHEAQLRRAAVAIDATYSFVGRSQYQYQARSWPRVDIGLVDGWPVNPDTIPQAVKDAQCELAWLIHEGFDPLANLPGVVARTRAKAGPVETETEYLGGLGIARMTAVDRLLRDYLSAGGTGYAGSVGLVRA